MTYQTDCTLPEELLEQIAQQGLDVLPEIKRIPGGYLRAAGHLNAVVTAFGAVSGS